MLLHLDSNTNIVYSFVSFSKKCLKPVVKKYQQLFVEKHDFLYDPIMSLHVNQKTQEWVKVKVILNADVL